MSGRVTGLAADPVDVNTMFVATAGGGIWKTINGGTSWSPRTDKRSTIATLKEAVLAVKEGCRISTFALIEDYYGMDWVSFVEQLTRLTKGVAFYTSSGELASCIMESYLSGRKKKSYVA